MQCLNFRPFIPPIEPIVCWSGGFTPEECDRLIEIGELKEFESARVGDAGNNQENLTVRNTDVTWLHPADDTHWIFERMGALAAKINFDKFQLDLDVFDGFQFTRYKQDQHYDWHTDTMNTPPDGKFRKLSMIAMLTDPQEYEGGDVLFAPDGGVERVARWRPKKGDILAFYSHTPHKVEPVTSGRRITLVTWVKGDKLR